MAGSHEKRRQLDDEMSRFEAEILGTPQIENDNQPHSLLSRPIIGSNTFRQVQQQLRQSDGEQGLPPPPEPPQLLTKSRNGPMLSATESRPQSHGSNSLDSSHSRLKSQNNSDRGRNDAFSKPSDGPQDRRPGMFGPLLPPPPPPAFLNQRPQGGSNFQGPCRGMGPPPPPPGFIPPQLNRPMGPMMGPGPNMGPRPPVNFLPPPPPPPGLLHQGHLSKMLNSGNPTISKPPTIISSAPKIYSKEPDEATLVKAQENSPMVIEPKKKKQKIEPKPMEVTSHSSFTHAQEMAEKVKQSMITTKVAPSVPNAPSHGHSEEKKKEKKSKKNLRYAGGQVWEDPALNDWEHDDFRMFAGDLGNDVTDELLHRYFSHFPSFIKAKVVREKRTNKSKGYGFVSFKDPQDYIRAMKEMNGKYVGSRPIKLRKSTWRDRSLEVVQRKQKEKQTQGLK